MKTLFLFAIFLRLITAPGGTNRSATTENNMTDNQQPLFSFGVITDVQYCDCNTYNTRFYRNSAEKLRRALSEISSYSPDFILNLGDLIDREFSSFDTVMNLIEETGITTWHCLGNHDYSVSPGDIRKVSQVTGSKTGYYSFVHKSFRFIILNGTDVATYAATPAQRKKGAELLAALTERGAVNAYEWNGGISANQLKWLINQLDDASVKNEKVFIICHFPVFPEGTHNLFNSSEILSVMRNYQNIIAWFNGHNHDGGYGNSDMIHFVTFRAMVETENTNSFAVVEVYSNKIWIKGSGREKSQILAY
ncbi:MAG: metallophosphoesterase [Bacteroidales bacterium]|nr:metallophosphoesterase [Bacteroidales bacterium]